MKILKIIGIIILIPIVLIIGFLVILSLIPMTPNNYTKETKTGGNIEAKYLAMGNYKFKSTKKDGSELTKKYYIYYPKELKETNKKYPAVVVLNGTGVLPNIHKEEQECLQQSQ